MSIYAGTSNATKQESMSFDDLYAKLMGNRPYPVLPSASPNPYNPSLSHAITELHVHPCLEAILHILNNDLPSAHFLCRHMENKPAYEAMYIHGILHRVEGDYRNAEAWYGDVAESDCFQDVWSNDGGLEGGKHFILDIEKLRKQKIGDAAALQLQSKREIEAMLAWCKQKFGMEKVVDATVVWVDKPPKNKEMASKMLVGGEGWRQF